MGVVMNGYHQRKDMKKNILKFHRNGKKEYEIYRYLADVSNSSIYYTYRKTHSQLSYTQLRKGKVAFKYIFAKLSKFLEL